MLLPLQFRSAFQACDLAFIEMSEETFVETHISAPNFLQWPGQTARGGAELILLQEGNIEVGSNLLYWKAVTRTLRTLVEAAQFDWQSNGTFCRPESTGMQARPVALSPRN
jgi:hypothetical protein